MSVSSFYSRDTFILEANVLASFETILFRTCLLRTLITMKYLLAKWVQLCIAITLVVDRHLLSEKLILKAGIWDSWLKHCWIISRVNTFNLILFHFSPISPLFPVLIRQLSSPHPLSLVYLVSFCFSWVVAGLWDRSTAGEEGVSSGFFQYEAEQDVA